MVVKPVSIKQEISFVSANEQKWIRLMERFWSNGGKELKTATEVIIIELYQEEELAEGFEPSAHGLQNGCIVIS